MKRIGIFLLLFSSLAWADTWATHTDKHGVCTFLTPKNWQKDSIFIVQPDGHARVSVISGAYTPAMITQATAGFKKKILEQDANHVLYRIEITGTLRAFATLEYYQAIFKDKQGCIARSNTDLKNPVPLEGLLRQIVSGVKFK